jgi:hypothetical protein
MPATSSRSRLLSSLLGPAPATRPASSEDAELQGALERIRRTHPSEADIIERALTRSRRGSGATSPRTLSA